jgi:hypothetical protein
MNYATILEVIIVVTAITYIVAELRKRVEVNQTPTPLVSAEQAYRAHIAEENDHRIAWGDVGQSVEYVESPWIALREPGTIEVHG